MNSPTDPLRNAVSLKLREWLNQHPGRMESLARELGVSASTISMWASGARFPGSANLSALADALGIPLCRLLCPGSVQNPHCKASRCPECTAASD